jgi:hypothetical protein
MEGYAGGDHDNGIPMQNLSFTDSSFSAADSSRCELTIFCFPDSFSILVRQPEMKSVLHFRHTPFRYAGYHMLLRRLKELIPGDELLGLPFRKTTIVLGDRHLVIVPESLYSDKLPDYLFPEKKKQETETETVVISVGQTEANLVFLAGKELFDFLTVSFPGAEITHEMVPFLLAAQSNQTPVLTFHFHSEWFWAIATGNGRIEFVNSFDYQNETDMLYYVLSVVNNFRTGDAPVILTGQIGSDDSRFRMISKYIPSAFLPETAETVPDKIRIQRYLYGFISM